ncbi:MAG: T9SS type A sorting domain-containing protein [Ignavibacteria bacterium]
MKITLFILLFSALQLYGQIISNNISYLNRIADAGIREVDFDDNLVFATHNYSGFKVYDVSDPENLIFVSSYPALELDTLLQQACNLRIQNGFVYFITADELQVINSSDPYNLSFTDSISLRYPVDIAFYQNYAYLIDFFWGIIILDNSNPNDLTIAGKLQAGMHPYKIEIHNHIAFISDIADARQPKLQVLDISNPTVPKIVSTSYFTGVPRDFAVKDNYLFVALESEGIAVIDISDPHYPQLISRFNDWNNGCSTGVAVEGNYAYIADNLKGLLVADISDKNNPSLAGYFDYGGRPNRIRLHNHKIYLTDPDYGLLVLENDLINSVTNNHPVENNFELFQNYPNPFNSFTVLFFKLNKEEEISIKLYDVMGNYIETIFEGIKSAGDHKLIYNAKSLSAGVYFYKVNTGEKVMIKKMIYLK